MATVLIGALSACGDSHTAIDALPSASRGTEGQEYRRAFKPPDPFASAPQGNLRDLQPAADGLLAAARITVVPSPPTPEQARAPFSEEQMFDWAEARHADLFPTREDTKTSGKFSYRYYPATGVYMGISEGSIYLMGRTVTGGRLVRIAAVSDFAPRIRGCEQAAKVDAAGKVVLPPQAFEVEPPEDVNQDMGSLATLYPGVDTTTDAFYPMLPCDPSIGGSLPAPEPPPEGVEGAEELVQRFEGSGWTEGVIERLLSGPGPSFEPLADFTQGPCLIRTEATPISPGGSLRVDCNDARLLDSTMPFEGRDIIYVHGFNPEHLMDRILDPSGSAAALWPQDAPEFLSATGYFRKKAQSYWMPHIVEHLGPPPYAGSNPWGTTSGWQWTASDAAPKYLAKSNRFIVVAWNTSQSLEYAQHALLTQIRLAMTSHLNVQTPSNFPVGTVRPFCANGCVVIGHSTGPLVTSSAFGRAAEGDFGPGGRRVVEKMVLHVAMDGATSGSRIANAALAIAHNAGPYAGAAGTVLCDVARVHIGSIGNCNGLNLAFLDTSVLRDLQPEVARKVWRSKVEASPVPTVTIAGGHPRGNQAAGLTQWLLPGTDDGVVTMNSACGNGNAVFPNVSRPSGLTASSKVKAFEFSEWAPRLLRGTKLWLSQNHMMVDSVPANYLAGACTPYLSAAGMVMPVSNAWTGTGYDARNRLRNHYSFIQSVAEHSYDGGASSGPSLWPSYTGMPASALREYAPLNATGTTAVSGINVEESRVVTDPGAYALTLDSHGTRLIKPLDTREIVRGRKISSHMPLDIGNCTQKGTFKFRCTRWIWKRTYHLADKWEQKQGSHYVYEYVGRR